MQNEILNEANKGDIHFWKSIVKIGINQVKKKGIHIEVKLDDHSLSNNTNDVLEKWKVSFSSLFQSRGNSMSPFVYTNPNEAYQSPFLFCF